MPSKENYRMTAWLLIRLMAVIYCIAFVSLAVQVTGLIGSQGILPVERLIQAVSEHMGPERFFKVPTLCWFNHSDGFLLFLCWGGAAAAAALFVGVAPTVMALICWSFYLSLTTAGQTFLSFQWDALLLETGFLLLLLCPRHFRPRWVCDAQPPVFAIWLWRLLLFKLMFQSGLVKLLSNDPHWKDLTALTYHYWTQCLPNPLSWHAHHLPLWVHKASCFAMFMIELVIPFLIFCGRPSRLIAAVTFIGFQILIILTGNYGFFNLLTIVLSLSLLDDGHFKKIFPGSCAELFNGSWKAGSLANRIIVWTLGGIILVISAAQMYIGATRQRPQNPLMAVIYNAAYFRIVNNYGLFAMMTTHRMEIIIEGSADGKDWKAYEFRWKPGKLDQIPKWVMPHQPRLDWQMWFAALGSIRGNLWVLSLMERLLEGEEAVLKLLLENPFPDAPPKFVRAVAYDYQFTDQSMKKEAGQWWQRTYKGLYAPVLSLREE